MVAVIKVSSSINRILNYNENKVERQKAVCLGGNNFPGEAADLSFTARLNYFTRRMELNTNTKRNSLHISLNFDTSEKGLSDKKMAQIAHAYMKELGFGEQPYLMYRHHDAGHPHLHLVTTNIRADGSRIDLHHLGIRKSEPARKKLEEHFGLVRAEDRKNKKTLPEKILRPVSYGKTETRAAIQNVLEAVLDRYKYTSLHELNAVLGIYNVRAERGSEGSRMEQHKGLQYRILDDTGQPVGVPVKASLFYSRPTLQRLEGKFARNKITGKGQTLHIKNVIDRLEATKKGAGLADVEQALAREGITLVTRRNSEGFIYGLTYVEHKTGTVCNGSSLGKPYSAKGMQERFPLSGTSDETGLSSTGLKDQRLNKIADDLSLRDPDGSASGIIREISGLLDKLVDVERAPEYVSKHYTRKRKKRKRRGPL
ncbi:relaxase [Flavobacterium suaedae]|uniref:Relaxase n=1 Tax=Flavobacterium suaedae TaxID=1767027 RepID=A0ABQ1JBS0_9FLAO|nr:relaxase/mobilization nuclease domain-containing protein [Flavobacterium suaedae]GGB64416.1 relaxase [Flavobacterium suaedae]